MAYRPAFCVKGLIMKFSYKNWRRFCTELRKVGLQSVPANKIDGSMKEYVVLKHDVETNVKHAYDIACIEYENGHCGSYYVQAYLLEKDANIELLKKMQDMGHEVSYHYDVLDSSKGDLDQAIEEFERNRIKFEKCGFEIKTVCQHGNPVVERIGYTSNRDFFRSDRVKNLYPNISDIMVNYKYDYKTDYQYFSDAGRRFKNIYDPLNNDIEDSSEKDVVYENLEELLRSLKREGRYIISIHPHRWTKSSLVYVVKTFMFRVIRFIARIVMKVPFMKKFMSKYYYLAKKI